jgi:hypothetical protein
MLFNKSLIVNLYQKVKDKGVLVYTLYQRETSKFKPNIMNRLD